MIEKRIQEHKKAAEQYVKDNFPNLKPTYKSYQTKVDNKFTQLIINDCCNIIIQASTFSVLPVQYIKSIREMFDFEDESNLPKQ